MDTNVLCFGFTAEQQDWYDSLVPAVPEEVVAHLLAEYPCADKKDDLLQEAYVGTAAGIHTFDKTKARFDETKPENDPLRQWVFFSALRAAQLVLRKDKRYNRLLQALWAAVTVHCQDTRRTFDLERETDETYRAALSEFRSGVAAAAYVGAALFEAPTGDDDPVEREMAARCAAGLEQALEGLSERRRDLLRMHFSDDMSIKAVAAARGERGYRAELVEFHRAVDLVRARFVGMGFDERPPFPREAGGTILRESSPAHGPPAKGHVAVRLDIPTLARIDALVPLYALPGREATRSDALRAVLLAGIDIEERRVQRNGGPG
jgi:DNA-directed RNA polymerase specialized sigma24 family protein